MLRVSSIWLLRTRQWGLGVRGSVSVLTHVYVMRPAPVHNWHLVPLSSTFKGRLISHYLQRAPFLFSEMHNAHTSINSLQPSRLSGQVPDFPLAVTAVITH